MAQRAYIIVLEDDGTGEEDPWSWFEECVKESVLDSWNNCGFSAMDFVNLTVPAEDADEDYPEGSDVDGGDTMQELQDTVDLLRRQIAQDKAE